MKFKKGDVVVGKSSADFLYRLTNSHSLLLVDNVLGDKLYLSIIMFEDREPTTEEKKISTLVESDHFCLATDKDKSKFLISSLVGDFETTNRYWGWIGGRKWTK